MIREVKFESQDRRIKQILACLNKHGIASIEEANQICFPRYEVFGLSSQMQRAAVSIPSNIAEGYGRASNPDLIHFLHIALGSSNELDTQILIARNEEYITEEEFHQLEDLNDNVMRMLQSLIYTRKKYEMQTGQTSKP